MFISNLEKFSLYIRFFRLFFGVLPLVVFFFLFSLESSGQIAINNPGMEGTPCTDCAPPGWDVCALTPDIQPGQWCVDLAPHQGASYAGFVAGEFIGQRLPSPILAGENYTFTVWLSHHDDYGSTMVLGACADPRNAIGSLEFYGGTVACAQSELLWVSPPINHTGEWRQYTVTFTPSATYDYIMFKNADVSGLTLSNILLDDMTPVIEPACPNIPISETIDPACENVSNGGFTLSAAGGVAPYEFSVDNVTYSPTNTFSGYPSGNQWVYVKDADGCLDSAEITIDEHQPISFTADSEDESCPGIGNGSIGKGTVSGGTPPYEYSDDGNNYSTTETFGGYTSGGPYTVYVQDAEGCKTNATTSVGAGPLPTVNAGSDQTVCEGDNVTLSGSGATTYVWDNGVTNGVAFPATTTQTYTVEGTDDNGCKNTDDVIITVNTPLDPGTGADGEVCIEAGIDLNSLLTGSPANGTWSKVGSFTGSLAGSVYTPDATTPPGDYTFECTFEDPAGVCPDVSLTVDVTVLGKPTTENLQITCAQDRATYVVSFDIIGGDPSSYSVNPAGTITGNTFTSNPITNATPSTFQVSDGNACGFVTVDALIDCACNTMSGTMQQGLTEICGTDPFNVIPKFQNDSVNDGDDDFMFYLHEGNGITLINPVDSNQTGEFAFDDSRMDYDKTYYVSIALANAAANGIDRSDICFSLSPGAAVVWHQIPELSVANDSIICINDNNYNLRFNFTKGKAPYSVDLEQTNSGGTISSTEALVNDNDQISFTPTVTTTYEVINFTDDNGCVGVINDGVKVATVHNLTTATMTYSGGFCQDNGNLPTLNIQTTGDTNVFSVLIDNDMGGYDSLVITGTSGTYNPTIYLPNDSVIYTLSRVYGIQNSVCPTTVSGEFTFYPTPTSTLSGGDVLCEGDDIDLRITTTGIGPWNVYVSDGVNTGNQVFTIYQSNDTIVTSAYRSAGAYTFSIDSVVDLAHGCSRNVNSGTASFTINPSPRLVLHALDANNTPQKAVQICEGGGMVTVEVSGFPSSTQNYDVTYAVVNSSTSYPNEVMSSTNNQFLFPETTPGTYQVYVSQARDNSPAACPGIGDTVTITVNPLPTLTLSATTDTICLGDSVLISGNTTGTPNIQFSVADANGLDGDSYTLSEDGSFTFYVTPDNFGVTDYFVVGNTIVDGSTPQCSNTATDRISFVVNEPYTASILDTLVICEGSQYTMPIYVSGPASARVYYSVDGTAESQVLNASGGIHSGTFDASNNYYDIVLDSVVDITQAACPGTVLQSPGAVFVQANPTAHLTYNPAPICDGETVDVLFTTTGNAPITIRISNENGQEETIVTDASGNATIQRQAFLEYSMTIIDAEDATITTEDGSHCYTQIDSIADLDVNPLPTGTVGRDTTICPGIEVGVYFSLQGAPPFDVEYTNPNGGVVLDTSVAGDYSTSFIFNDLTRIDLLSVTDDNGCRIEGLIDTMGVSVHEGQLVEVVSLRPDSCQPYNAMIDVLTDPKFGQIRNCRWEISNGETLTGCFNHQVYLKDAGTYGVRLDAETEKGCPFYVDEPSLITVFPNPIAAFRFSNSEMDLLNSSTRMINDSRLGDRYTWSFGFNDKISFEEEPRVNFPNEEPGVYPVKLLVETENGCLDSTERQARVEFTMDYYMPTAFTPNGDGVNDDVKPSFSTYNLSFYEYAIFNRWGQMLFYTNDPQEAWDGVYQGEVCDDGTYAYMVRYSSIYDAYRKRDLGHVNLLK